MWQLLRGALPGWGTPGGAEGRGVVIRGVSWVGQGSVVGEFVVGEGQAGGQFSMGGQCLAADAVDQGSQEGDVVLLYQQVKLFFTRGLFVSVRARLLHNSCFL